jgi:hypothetical protein
VGLPELAWRVLVIDHKGHAPSPFCFKAAPGKRGVPRE